MENLNSNAQAIILLAAHFNKGDKPLTISEYAKFAKWLKECGKQPGDLLKNGLEDVLGGWEDKKITHERLRKLLDRGNAMAIALEKWQNAGIWILTRADEAYPKRLKKRLGHKAPPLFYGAGEKKILRTRGVAIVGSRNVGQKELDFAFELGKKLAMSGYSVVSGAARGVDEASMMGSIEAEGTTIGVVADDLMKKVLSKQYRQAIMRGNLVLLSPYYPEARFSVGNAMGRNKYIYTLADAAVVVHSGQKGGTWEGARENLKHRWVPMHVKEVADEQAGNAALIEQGALRLDRDILKKETLDSLFEAKFKHASIKSMDAMAQTLEERIIKLLDGKKMGIKEVAQTLEADEKEVRKRIMQMTKSGVLKKYQHRPMLYSKARQQLTLEV